MDALNAAERSIGDTIPNLEDIKAAAKKGALPHRAEGPAKPFRGQEAQAPLVVSVPTKGSNDGKADNGGDKKVIGGGPRKVKGGEKWDMATGKEAPAKDGKEDDEEEESEEQHEIEIELNGILKKGPSTFDSLHGFNAPHCLYLCETCCTSTLTVVCSVIIFSKSYCPFSAKAKRILLEKYTIIPEPYVVELDQHPLGQGLQAHLAKSTGRKTVPNVLINGKSIGGGDEVAALDGSGGMIDKVKGMGGRRIMEAKLTSRDT